MHRHANGVVSRFALECLAYGSTAGGREYVRTFGAQGLTFGSTANLAAPIE
jgi:hypothetical protein